MFGMRFFLAGGLVLLLASTGCGSGASDAPAGPAAATTEVRVDRSFWYAGFKVTLGAARLRTSPTAVVVIDATFQNLGPDEAAPSDELVLGDTADNYYEPDRADTDLPTVAGLRSRPGVMAFEVDDRFLLADAVLTVGGPQDRQAIVPLGRPDGLIALEPRPVTVAGKVSPDDRADVFMTLTGGEVRADDPSRHEQAPAGQEFVLLTFTATNTGAAGMTYVFDRDLTLILPDGTETGHAGACSRAQVHVESHSTVTPPGPACFSVPVPARGDYRFVWGETKSKGLSFSLG